MHYVSACPHSYSKVKVCVCDGVCEMALNGVHGQWYLKGCAMIVHPSW